MTGCYESKTVIELNPDGSGVMTTTANFDNATEDQRQQIKALFKDPNADVSYSRSEMEESFPKPYFEIVELSEDQETLNFKSVIKFKDINRLLAVDSENSMLKGVDFNVEGDEITFKITRSSQESGLGENITFLGSLDKFSQNISPKETIKIVDPKSGNAIEFSHEYKGDDSAKEITWNDRLKIAGHTIQRNSIKYNFVDYPVLNSPNVDITSASWNRIKQYKAAFHSRLDLDLTVTLPPAQDSIYLGYDQIYLMAGAFSDGTPAEIDKTWQKGFKGFNDAANMAGAGRFKLPMTFLFPKNRVDSLAPLKVKVRLLGGKNFKRMELGKLLPNHTYESAPFTFTTKDLANDELELEVKGPISQLEGFFLKTGRDNLFPLKSSSWPSFESHGSVRFWKFLPLKDTSLSVDFYDVQEYVWLDIDVPSLDFKKRDQEDSATGQGDGLTAKLFPQFKNIPSIPDSVYKDKNSFEQYWKSLNDENIIPALLAVFSDMKRLRENSEIDYWYQVDLGKALQERGEFFESNKKEIAHVLFKLFLEMPDQNGNQGITSFLSNAGLSEYLRADALQAIKDKKLRNGIDVFFKGELTGLERSALNEVFQESDYWVESVEILKLLTKGPDGDLALAKRVLEDKTRNEFVRKEALAVLIDQHKDISADMLKEYLMDPVTRQQLIYRISDRLGEFRSDGQIPKEQLIEMLRPLKPIFEDLAEEKDNFNTGKIKKILEDLNNG